MSDKQILSNVYLNGVKKGDYCLSIEELFSPYIQATQIKSKVMFTTLNNFKSKLKITSDILDHMKIVWEKAPNAILAGGKVIDFVLNKSAEESKNDYDVYNISSSHGINPFFIFKDSNFSIDKCSAKSFGHLTEFSTKDGIKYQFMHKVYCSPEEIIEDFDFRCCSICTNGKFIWWTKGCLKDIRDKKLVILSSKAVLSNFIRIQKYLNKGYSISCVDYNILCINTLQSLLNYNYSNNKHSKDKFAPIIFNRDHVYNREEMQYSEDFFSTNEDNVVYHVDNFVAREEHDQITFPVRDIRLPNLRTAVAQAVPLDEVDF